MHPVNALAGSIQSIDSRKALSAVFSDTEGRDAALLLELAEGLQVEALARALLAT